MQFNTITHENYKIKISHKHDRNTSRGTSSDIIRQ